MLGTDWAKIEKEGVITKIKRINIVKKLLIFNYVSLPKSQLGLNAGLISKSIR